MSILKRLFAKKPQEPERDFIPRPPRVRIKPLHRVTFLRFRDAGRDEISLGNISTKGMGLLRREIENAPIGAPMRGELAINDGSFLLESEVRHQSEHLIGCQFVGANEPLVKAIEHYFRIEILGMRLNQVDQAFLKQDPMGRVSWYTDGKQNEIYFVFDADGVHSFHVSFLGNYIEGGREKALRCGHIVEDTSFNQNKHKGSALLDLSQPISDEVLSLGSLLIENVEMPNEHIDALKALLKAR